MTLRENIQTAIREPWKIPPWLAARSTGPARRIENRVKTSLISDQEIMLSWLRRSDEWLLIVLDACRYDVFADAFDVYFDGEVEPVRSAGHDTFEYVQRCWPEEYDLPYISGATPINDAKREYEDQHLQQLYDGYVPHEHLTNIVDAWDFGWDESLGTCPPWAVTDAALKHADHDRLVAHYFQPHAPYIGDCELLGHTDDKHADPHDGLPVDKPIWEAVKKGLISDEELRTAYESNLQVALREVCRLIDDTDFKRIYIMGDHGEALGEWNVYSHPRTPHAKIRTVPWARIDGLTAAGEQAAQSAVLHRETSDIEDGKVSDRLEALGYV